MTPEKWLELGLTILAIITAPIITWGLSVWRENRRDKKGWKFWVFKSLLERRHAVIIREETVQAMNLIEVVYHDNDAVRAQWQEYVKLRKTKDVSQSLVNETYLKMLSAMSKDLGFSSSIDQVTLNRFYQPDGLVQSEMDNADFNRDFVRLMKGFFAQLEPKVLDQTAKKIRAISAKRVKRLRSK